MFCKKMFLKFSQYSQEYTDVEAFCVLQDCLADVILSLVVSEAVAEYYSMKKAVSR